MQYTRGRNFRCSMCHLQFIGLFTTPKRDAAKTTCAGRDTDNGRRTPDFFLLTQLDCHVARVLVVGNQSRDSSRLSKYSTTNDFPWFVYCSKGFALSRHLLTFPTDTHLSKFSNDFKYL